ncbi:AbfB domain-containing protein [Streptomyces flavalbus]|uniref:AbfB domain-containing protein n=1 Tax=Streptomyces flavalbus TaxID=2665155 RepID=A0ABW2W0W5_9ACTN
MRLALGRRTVRAARPGRRSGHQPLQSADAKRCGGEERRDISDSVGVSYESHRLPGRCLRHYDYLPHVQPLGTAPNRADATFSTQ